MTKGVPSSARRAGIAKQFGAAVMTDAGNEVLPRSTGASRGTADVIDFHAAVGSFPDAAASAVLSESIRTICASLRKVFGPHVEEA